MKYSVEQIVDLKFKAAEIKARREQELSDERKKQFAGAAQKGDKPPAPAASNDADKKQPVQTFKIQKL